MKNKRQTVSRWTKFPLTKPETLDQNFEVHDRLQSLNKSLAMAFGQILLDLPTGTDSHVILFPGTLEANIHVKEAFQSRILEANDIQMQFAEGYLMQAKTADLRLIFNTYDSSWYRVATYMVLNFEPSWHNDLGINPDSFTSSFLGASALREFPRSTKTFPKTTRVPFRERMGFLEMIDNMIVRYVFCKMFPANQKKLEELKNESPF